MHSGIINPFDGENVKDYKKWVKAIEKWKLLHDANDAATKRVAFLTSQGPVSDYIQRFLTRNPDSSWETMKAELKVRFADVVDGAQAFSLLKKLKQGNQSVAIYGERCQSVAEDAFRGITGGLDSVQKQITNCFIEGLNDDQLKIRLYREAPDTLREGTFH